MDNSAYVALSRQDALWRKMDTIANNIANMNTPGFKGETLYFVDFVIDTPNTDGAFDHQVAYVRDLASVRDNRPGALSTTNNPFDVAFDGSGFLVVEMPDGTEAYTRNGRLRLGPDGILTSASGHPLMNIDNQPIFLAPNESDVTIAADGTIRTELGPIGQLRLVDFEEPDALLKIGDSLLRAGEEQEPEDLENPRLMQGVIEESNVNAVAEMARMIEVHRAYESAMQLLNREDERERDAIDTISRRASA